MSDKKIGKGWRGDTKGHADAGRKGGLKRAENRRKALQAVLSGEPEQ